MRSAIQACGNIKRRVRTTVPNKHISNCRRISDRRNKQKRDFLNVEYNLLPGSASIFIRFTKVAVGLECLKIVKE